MLRERGMGHALRHWVVLWGLGAVACNLGGASSAATCQPPASGSGSGTLLVAHQHQFAKEYQVVDVSYTLDGCQLFRVTDTAKLDHPEVELGSYSVAAGTHVVVVTTVFESGSSADMHAYKWMRRDPIQVVVPAGGQLHFTARFHEERHDDPRQRMRVELLTSVTPAPAP
jgi:hypothetical protein